MFNIGKIKSSDGAGSGSTTLSTTSVSAALGVVVTMAEKHLGTNMGTSLRKHSKRVAPEEPVDASRSTTKALAEKGMEPIGRGKELTEVEEVSEQGYSIRELCEVEDQAGANRYFTSIMMRLKINEGEDPPALRWSSISGSTWVWTKGPLAGEYLRGSLHPILAKQLYEYSSEDLMNRAAKSVVWVMVAAYKASRGFESSPEKMGQVSYKFGYRVALERLLGKHPEIKVEQDLFAECPEDGNVMMDLN
ncbi:hypothetical protein BHM03_00051625 [Ensete ventricosum]|nr:hypothetical protein BHM03_00051625 [Ensete ventricosum]